MSGIHVRHYRFDRKMQHFILACCMDYYPLPAKRSVLTANCDNQTVEMLIINSQYLAEHDLIQITDSDKHNFDNKLNCLKITAKGIDFMLHDGGLSAILNVQTIKFHREAVVVLEDLFAMSNMNDEQKEKAKSTLGELSTEALKTVVQAATTAGLSALLGK